MSRRLILRSFQSPGDVLMLTAAVRDLHLAQPGKFVTDVRTSADALWTNNPRITRLNEHEPGVEAIECHYPLVHQANSRPYHFIHGYAQFLEQRLGVSIPLTRFSGDIHLSPEEKARPLPFAELGLRDGFWIVMAGGKYDFTAKWWNPAAYQAVADHFQGRVQFAQCGEAGHWHPRLNGVVDLVGRTSLRDFVVLMYHASGVLCPVTFAMHLAAAVETPPRRPRRPCVVVAGAREPAHWEQYPGHQFLHTLGSLPCCANDPCWRSRCQLVGDGDAKDRREVCERPVQLTPELRIAECMALITPDDVIRAIERYGSTVSVANGAPSGPRAVPQAAFAALTLPSHPQADGRGEGGLQRGGGDELIDHRSPHAPLGGSITRSVMPTMAPPPDGRAKLATSHGHRATDNQVPILIDFRHGLGDAVQLTTVLMHLRHYHADWQIDVAAGVGKLPPARSESKMLPLPLGEGRGEGGPCASSPEPLQAPPPLYHRLLIREHDAIDRRAYQHVFELSWDECQTCYADSPSTKAEHCLRSVFALQPIAELCRYELTIGDAAWAAAKSYLHAICPAGARADGRYPAVLLHYQGNTSCDMKDLSHELARRVCQTAMDAGFVPVILDWDRRSPLPDGAGIFCPTADHPLWGGSGTGDCERLAALMAQAALFVGIDSGPLHVAGSLPLPPHPQAGTRGWGEGGKLPLPPHPQAGTRGRGEGGLGKMEDGPAGLFSNLNDALGKPTPALAVWTGHHPLHYFGLADHVTHLVPEDHASRLRGDRALGQTFFEQHYRRHVYQDLAAELPALVASTLTGEPFERTRNKEFLRALRATGYTESYYQEHKLAGLDYLAYGDWQRQYGCWLVESLALKGKRLLDVGCACGAILRGFGDAGAITAGVDVSEAMIRRGREKWPDMAGLLHVCDAVNLHLFGDGSWDAVHTAQVAEHWKPDLVPHILRELARVTAPGGLWFCALDTKELFERQKRTMAGEDPTHVCIRPLGWWHEQLAAAGWQVCTAEHETRLRRHADSFLPRYDWDWFLARRQSVE